MAISFVFIDGIPIWEETLSVVGEWENEWKVVVVSSGTLRLPRHPSLRGITMGLDRQKILNWFAEKTGPGHVVVTRDAELVRLSLQKGASVLSPEGHVQNIEDLESQLVADRLLRDLESFGAATGGALPLNIRDRSRFTMVLRETVLPLQEARKSEEGKEDLPFRDE